MRNLNGFEIEVFNVHGIKQGATTSTCPKCSHNRKKKTDKCAMVDWERGLMTCQHCGEVTQLHTYKKQYNTKPMTKEYSKPTYKPFEGVYSDKLTNYVQIHRQINLSTLKRLKIRECKEWMPQTKQEENCIAFDYYYQGVLINTKFRDGRKNFKLVKDAEKILYNIDSIVGSKTAMVVEGEFDVCAWDESGYHSCTSVPNGFTVKGNINLDYLDNYIDLFEDKETIYIGVDGDEAGTRGKEELIRRFGAERCKIIDYGDCKDANDYKKKYGNLALYGLLSNAKEIKVSGIYSMDDFEEEILSRHKNGQKRGTTTHFANIDKAWTWREGEVNMWTGYENEGKSLFINQLALIKAVFDGWKFAVFSPENSPLTDFFTDLIETYIGKSADPIYKNNYMNDEEIRIAISDLKKLFFVIYPDEDFKINTLFEKTEWLVKKHGIRGVIFDPYNTIEHEMERGEREDLYISRFMAKLKRFSVKHSVSFNLIAHQNTARVNKDDGGRYYKPDLNNIKGGGTFSAKTDNALIVWRPNRALDFRDPEVLFASQKIKKQKLVGHPQEIDRIVFDIKKQRYYIDGVNPLDILDKERNKQMVTGNDLGMELDVETGEYKPKSVNVFKENNINGLSEFEYQDAPF